MISPSDLAPGRLAQFRAGENAEQWLVQRVSEDPAILGLGDLELKRAHPSCRAGQVGLLLEDRAELSLYVVELQFGITDDRHVIRVVERWAAERKRQRTDRCFAVLVAEQVPQRYLNILQLISSAVPLLAMEMQISETEGKVVMAMSSSSRIHLMKSRFEPWASSAIRSCSYALPPDMRGRSLGGLQSVAIGRCSMRNISAAMSSKNWRTCSLLNPCASKLDSALGRRADENGRAEATPAGGAKPPAWPLRRVPPESPQLTR